MGINKGPDSNLFSYESLYFVRKNLRLYKLEISHWADRG